MRDSADRPGDPQISRAGLRASPGPDALCADSATQRSEAAERLASKRRRPRNPRGAGPQPIAGRCLRRYECRSPRAIAGVPVFLRSESEPHQGRFAGWKPGTRRRPARTAPFRRGRGARVSGRETRFVSQGASAAASRHRTLGQARVFPSGRRHCGGVAVSTGQGHPRTVKPAPKSSDRAISTNDVYAARNRGLRRKGLPHPWY